LKPFHQAAWSIGAGGAARWAMALAPMNVPETADRRRDIVGTHGARADRDAGQGQQSQARYRSHRDLLVKPNLEQVTIC
jgi:hypothetical protein